MTQLSKADACALLHISESTMTRRLKAGRYTCTRSGIGKYDPITFSYADIGLTEPVADRLSEHPEQPALTSSARPEPIPDISTPDAFNPREYTDSFGHTITGNAGHKMFETQVPAKRAATDDHMPEGIRTVVTGGDGGSEDHPINQMMIRAGLMKPAERPMTDTQRRQFVDRAAFQAGLRQGYSR
jgi:hypothetical protein